MSKLSIGIIGCGEIVEQFHLPILQRLDSFGVAWVCDINLDRAKQFARRFDVPNAYEAIEHCQDVSAVLVATPVGSRKSILSKVFQRGWHAFCEKPFAVTLLDHDWMLDSARSCGAVLAGGYMRRHYWATQTASSLLGEFRDGDLLLATISDCQRMKRSFHGGNWYLSNPRDSGGGFLMETGSHLIDQVLTIIGARDISLERVVQKREGSVDFETVASGILTARSGEKIPFHFVLSRLRDMWSGIAISTSERRLELSLSPGSSIVLTNLIEDSRCVLPSPNLPSMELIEAYTAQLLKFADRVRIGETHSNAEATGLLATKFLDRCYEVGDSNYGARIR